MSSDYTPSPDLEINFDEVVKGEDEVVEYSAVNDSAKSSLKVSFFIFLI